MNYTPLSAMEAMNAAFLRIPRDEIQALLAKKTPLSLKQGMAMAAQKGKRRMIDVQLRPWVVDNRQRRFFHRNCLLLKDALARLMPLYLQNAAVRKILPLSGDEHEWMMEANARGVQKPQSVMDRLDATATFAATDWENFWFLEPNSVGIGGIHYIPSACILTDRWILPTLKAQLPDLRFVYPDDIRDLLLKLFVRHSKGIGRKLKRVVLVEDRSGAGGTDEFRAVARYLKRQGLAALVADPRDVEIWKGEVTVRRKVVDLVYRDTEIREIMAMFGKRNRRHWAHMREAFVRNQVISSIGGEFDHKSCWELFTDPEFSSFFTLRQRFLFKSHVLWTRLLWERETTDPKARPVDLVRFIRRHREELVLKPNRAYGGVGVVFGHQVDQARWETELAKALNKPFTTVVQKAAQVRAELFPVAYKNGNVRLEPYFTVTGFAATTDGMALLGRSSKESVVNVSRRGGLVAVWRLG